MEEFEEGFTISVNDYSRKREATGKKRNKKKELRHKRPQCSRVFTSCRHKNKKLSCFKIRPNDASFIRKKLYSTETKAEQDSIVASWLHIQGIKRRRPRQDAKTVVAKPREFGVLYSVPRKNSQPVMVCKKFFMSLTCFKSTRLHILCKKIKNGEGFAEKRGGDRIGHKSLQKKDKVREFLKNLKGTESHYNRKKTARIYLHCELSINKLRSIYNASVPKDYQVKRGIFRNIFAEYNIGFRSPASDTCTFCTRITYQIKHERDLNKKAKLMAEKRIHTLRGKAFYESLRTPDSANTMTFCFDLQQVQPLPKTPIQEAYYSRQISFYNFCIVNQKSLDPYFYTWIESQSGRGSLEVSSAVLNFLSMKITDNQKIQHLRLFADGCGGQNKNNIVLHALMYFLANTSNKTLKKITLTFPVRGHSFLPADRVFGRVEKKLVKKCSIFSTEEYKEVLETFGIVMELGKDWHISDTKSLSTLYKNLENISNLKVITITKKAGSSVYVNGQMFYKFSLDNASETLLKRGITFKAVRNFHLNQLPLKHTVGNAKKKDVDALLIQLLGKDWRTLETFQARKFYSDIIDSAESDDDEDATTEGVNAEETCDCLEEDCALHI